MTVFKSAKLFLITTTIVGLITFSLLVKHPSPLLLVCLVAQLWMIIVQGEIYRKFKPPHPDTKEP